jgi:hypothetical protein
VKSLSLLLALAVAAPMAADCPSVSWLEQSSADATGLPFLNNIVAVDFDHDGNDDIVYHQGQGSSNGTLFMARSTGNHSCETPVTLATEMSSPLKAGDINGDGWTDVVTTTIGGSMVVFPGAASGFGSPWFPGPGVRTFDLGNFDGDPQLEIVTAGDGTVAYWDFSGGTFVKQAQRADGTTMIGVAGGDFDGDGRTDIAIATWNPMALRVFFRNADATFTSPVVLTVGTQPTAIAAGDLNGDGKAEIALADWEDTNIRIYRAAPSRQFTQSAPLPLKKPNQTPFGAGVQLFDVSGDGKLDLLGSTPNGWWLSTWVNAGDGTFLSPSFTDNAGPGAYAIGDFDGDDTLDIYSATFEGRHFFSAACATQVYAYPRAQLISAVDPAVLNAVISGFPATPPPDRGNVTFREGATVLGVASVDATGAAALSVEGLTVGEHTLVADFSGNAAVPAGLSLPFVQTVTNDVTTLTITTPEESPVHGVPWPVTIEVEGDTQAFVDVYVDGVLRHRHHLPNNPLNLVMNAGAHTIRVFYQGTSFLAAAEEELSVTAAKAAAAMEISGERSVRTGTAHALQFTLSGPEGAPVPTGTVTLTENGVTRGSGSLVNGVATINVTFALGAHDVRATYGGNAGYQSKFTDFTLHVLPNFPVSIAARGIPGSIHIAYALWPDVNPESLKLFRRVNGTTEWSWLSSWNRNDGRDLTAAAGTAYEYRLDAQLTGGTPINSNMDTAIRFNDDPLTAGLKIKQLHFNEIRMAVNLLRAQAGLSPFHFEAGFSTNRIIRASHINGLRTAVNEARAALGMSTFSFAAISAGTKVNAADVLQVRDAAR